VELFCALLTGFFLWLFLFHWHYAALARAREMAGGLLIDVVAAHCVVRIPPPTRPRSIVAFLV
jgi:hypothetical protein